MNCQDEQIPKLSLDLHFVQQLKEVTLFFAGEHAGGQDGLWMRVNGVACGNYINRH